MIERYSRLEIAALFTDQARMNNWLTVEKAVLSALVEEGIAPKSALQAIATISKVDVDKVKQREAEINHDLAAFVDVISMEAPEAAGWFHYGLTSSDIVDTALALQLSTAGKMLLTELDNLLDITYTQAQAYRHTPMLGRTHGIAAETITFGMKLAGWWHQLSRDKKRLKNALSEISAGKLSGAVGAYSGISKTIEQKALHSLGLERDPSATQIVQRDRHAHVISTLGILASTLERIAIEIRHLQRTEVSEVGEAFSSSQKGSSAMPHKKNPITSEQICGLARIVRSHTSVATQDIALWHERDISHSSAERVIFPDAFILSDYLIAKTANMLENLVVNEKQMLENIKLQRGIIASQRVLLKLIQTGMKRDYAYRIVQQASNKVLENETLTLDTALAEQELVIASIDKQVLSELCDPAYIPNGVEDIFLELESLKNG